MIRKVWIVVVCALLPIGIPQAQEAEQINHNQFTKFIVNDQISIVELVTLESNFFTSKTSPSQFSAADTIHNGYDIFNPILSELQNVSIPIQLPSYLAAEELNDPSGLYAIIGVNEEFEYSIQVATDPYCDWNTACLDGALYGKKVIVTSPPDNSQIVSLANNIDGYFIDAECNISCSMAGITWFENDVKYTIKQKAAPKQTIILIANSAIESTIGQ